MRIALALVFAVLLVLGEASPYHQNDHHHEEKRFLGSIGNWINNNIINPVVDGINTGIDVISGGINQGIDWITGAVNTIADPFNSFINTLSGLPNTITNAVNDAVNFIKDQAMNVVVLVMQPNQPGQPAQQDLCKTTCSQKINFQGQLSEYFFDSNL